MTLLGFLGMLGLMVISSLVIGFAIDSFKNKHYFFFGFDVMCVIYYVLMIAKIIF